MTRLTTSCASLLAVFVLVACGSDGKSGAVGKGSDPDGSASSSSATRGSGGGSSVSGTSATGNVSDTGFSAASSTSGSPLSTGSDGSGGAAGVDDGAVGAVDGDGGDAGGAAGAGSEPVELEPGVLTAGIWDDNQNFDWFSGYYEDQNGAQLTGWFSSEQHDAAHEAALQGSGSFETLDIALVIDTTGSMGDELEYLQVEFEAISSAIEQRYGNAEQRWSLVVYRDEQDEYVTRSFDFTADLDAFRSDLGAQSYGGGGDFPEAPDRALEDMNLLDWRDDEGTLKLAFWVADAPHHDASENVNRLTQAIVDAQEQGIRVNPVASSGIDEFTEFTMRSAAQLTRGQYLFLTDDSGVGGEHKEPTVPCYYVTTLVDALVRVVDAGMTGEPVPVDQNQVVRTAGKPKATGVCDISGTEAVAF